MEIKVNQKVKVMNQRLDGTSFMEGIATVKKIIEDMNNGFVACQVRFEGDDVNVFRWIDTEIQVQS